MSRSGRLHCWPAASWATAYPHALATHQVSIGPGDLLVIATDGILEDHVQGIDFAAPAMAIAEHILNAYGRESDDALVLAARHRGVSS